MSNAGGWSAVEPVTAEVKEICLEVKPQIDKLIKHNSEVYTPISFARQIVNGDNYVVKVQVDVDLCVHAMIFVALPCEGGKPTVRRIQVPFIPSEPLVPF